MKKENTQIEKFLNNLEHQQLSHNQEAVVLNNPAEDNLYGGTNGDCTNRQTCNDTDNTGKCDNKRRCSDTVQIPSIQ